MEKLVFNIPPIAKGRPRISTRGGFARAYTPTLTRRYELAIAHLAREQWPHEPLKNAIKARITFYMGIPKSLSMAKRRHPIVKPDLDNLTKAIKDALNGIVWADDALIVQCDAQKIYDWAHRRVGVELQIEEVE